jgi:phosphoribosylaminoimidazolecarboxamide formyltransferase / IMP cyclohydrolase
MPPLPSLQKVYKPMPTALISVFDKTNLEPLARALYEDYGYTILSTGGTRQYLMERGIEATETSELTGFEELLGGRVKTLHPTLFAGILAERYQTPTVPAGVTHPIDLVIVNLYPFEQEKASYQGPDPMHLLHFIDIGGSALIRAAAKNYPSVGVVVDPGQYASVLDWLKQGEGELTLQQRRELGYHAFERSVAYDTAISQYFYARCYGQDASQQLPDRMNLTLNKVQDLRYGENPHQVAALYTSHQQTPDFTLLHGKELSFNNLLDMQAGWDLVTEFTDITACCIIKHNNPCGASVSAVGVAHAYQQALDCDPLSAFGGIVAVNQPVTTDAAQLMKALFLEVIIAPAFEPEALALLQEKKNLRLVTRPLPQDKTSAVQLKQLTETLYLAQAENAELTDQPDHGELKIVTQTQPDEAHWPDIAFAWTVVKHLKSNAIVLVKEGRTLGIGCGQTSRIGSMELALAQACDEAKGAVLASDGFFPAIDNIEAAAQARVGVIIQPGGSIKDTDVIDAANRFNMPMLTTGRREFKH